LLVVRTDGMNGVPQGGFMTNYPFLLFNQTPESAPDWFARRQSPRPQPPCTSKCGPGRIGALPGSLRSPAADRRRSHRCLRCAISVAPRCRALPEPPNPHTCDGQGRRGPIMRGLHRPRLRPKASRIQAPGSSLAVVPAFLFNLTKWLGGVNGAQA
jgi:hypothetical protein